jgi:hypothetical protein
MIRRNGVWYGIGALGLLSGVLVQGCADSTDRTTSQESDSEHKLGDLALGLTLPDGSEVGSVNYVVSKDGVQVRTGVLLVGSDGRASATLTGFDPGPGYQVVLTAPRDGGPTCSGQSSTFTVFADMTASVDVVLQCDNLTVDGNIAINGQFNVCPKVTSSSVTPLTVAIGSFTNITATASDRDGDPLTFAWSAPSGTFSAPTAANGTYTCASIGTQTLTVSVSDGPARGCTRSKTTTVTCVASGVDGGIDAGSVDAGSDAGGSAADAGVTSSSTAYLVPSISNVVIKPILSAGDSPNLKPDGTPYRMVGIPDGLGMFDNLDGTFTLLSNHELSSGGIARAHGGTAAFVSKWTIRTSDLRVLHGEDLIQSVQLWNKTTSAYAPAANFSFSRFCSADLAAPGAFFDAATSTGFSGRLFLNGEESGVEGRAMAHGLDGVSWELPRLGHQSWENQVASPASGLKTVVVGTDDTSPAGQVFVYVGTKTNTGSAIDRAGLTNGTLYGVKVTGVTAENNAAPIPTGPFTLASFGNVENTTGAQLETAAGTAGVTTFQRPEDGAWDPSNPNDFYFVSTASVTTNSRLWRLRFTDVKNPELGGTIENLVDGTEGHRMFDNITIDPRGHILLLEDVGGNERLGKVWRYTIATDNLTEIAAHDPARFSTGAPGFLTNDEEASGIIDATAILGAGWFLVDVQAHYPIAGELAEGGQYLAIFDPGTL